MCQTAVVRSFAALLLTVGLSGCVVGLAGMAASGAGLVNLAHKSGTMTVVMEGSGEVIEAFRSAAISAGGTVPESNADFARAEFSDADVVIEAQQTSPSRVRLRGASLSGAGRTWELEDGITNTTEQVVEILEDRGFVVIERERERGI